MSEHTEEQPATPNPGEGTHGDEATTAGGSPGSGPDTDDRHEPVEANGPVADRLNTDDLEPY